MMGVEAVILVFLEKDSWNISREEREQKKGKGGMEKYEGRIYNGRGKLSSIYRL